MTGGTASLSRATLPARRDVAASGLEELARLEVELEDEWTRLQAGGHGYAALRDRLAERKRDEIDDALRAAHEAQAAFLARLDEFQLRLHAHFMDQVVRELERAMQTMRAFYGPRRLRGIARRHRALERLAARYRALEPLYGTPRDHQRIAVYQRFYAGVVAFSARLRALDPTLPLPAPPSLLDHLYRARRGLVWLARRSGALVRLVVAAVRVLWTVLRKRRSGQGTPFTNRVDELFRAWGDVRGFEVEISGLEHVPRNLGRGCVALFTPAHRHGVTDNVTFSHLGLPDYLVFNAVDQLPFVPKPVKERVAQTDGLVPVGGGRGDAVKGALEALERDASRHVLIYPEGSVSEGFRGTRPPRPGFGERLVPHLREAGYQVQVVPVTYLDNARFLALRSRSQTATDLRRRVVVSPPLASDALDALLAAGGGAALNALVRVAWLENLVSDEELFLGHDRVRAIERRLDRELDGIRYWGSLESAPVRDVLATTSDDPVTVREEPFRGKRVRVLQLPASARDERDRIVLPDLQDPDSNELLLGIRPPAHIYLSLGRRRFDGDIFRRLEVKQRDHVYPGIFIRFLGVPVKSLHAVGRRLEEYAGREQRTLTCANSACQVIARAANLRIDDHAELRPFLPSHVLPTRTMRKLIERGVRNHAGEPVEVQIYKTDDRSLEAILAGARREEIRIARDHLRMLSVGALRSLRSRGRALLDRWFGRRSGRAL